VASLTVDTLARLRVCRDAGRPLPTDLLDDAIACLERGADAAQLRARRDALLRRAALLLPPAPPHRLAAMLAAEAKAMARTWHILRAHEPAPPYCTPRACLHAAALCARLPESQRQFYRVLRSAGADTAGRGVVSGDAPTITA
jgi:hypothetical protein